MLAKVVFALTVELAIFAAVLFGAAGTWRWPAAWAYLAIFGAGAIGISVLIAWKDPALLAERMKPPIQKDQPLWDKLFIPAAGLTMVAWFVLMAFDAVRCGWSSMSLGVQVAGGLLLALSFVMIARVFLENTFLAPVVKIQKERGHHVITTGPYAVVRHPMYAGILIHLPATALLLGSWYGTAGTLLLMLGMAYRTAREDAKLHEELAGYREYAARVRYRLIPFVW